MNKLDEQILDLAKDLQQDLKGAYHPPDEGFRAESQKVIPMSVVRGTRGYIEKVANQINGCYEKGWYDACAVMIRRLVETLFKVKTTDVVGGGVWGLGPTPMLNQQCW